MELELRNIIERAYKADPVRTKQELTCLGMQNCDLHVGDCQRLAVELEIDHRAGRIPSV
jgi:hypothetical protein